jgi:hypothetical protein
MSNADTHARRGQYLNLPDQGTAALELQEVLSLPLPFCRCAFRLVGNAADAEDVVQEALLAAYKHIDQFRGQSQMSTWLTTIVCNAASLRRCCTAALRVHKAHSESPFASRQSAHPTTYGFDVAVCAIASVRNCFGKKDGVPGTYGLGLTHDSEGNISVPNMKTRRARIRTITALFHIVCRTVITRARARD